MAGTINIIIPVLNEEETLVRQVAKCLQFLDGSRLAGNYIITLIDNGSSDGTQNLAVECKAEHAGKVDYIRLDSRGVGLALRTGIIANRLDYVGYMDLDLATDMAHLLEVYDALENGAEIAVGSRRLPKSEVIGRSRLRNITSWGLNTILKLYLDVRFSDAMCGFKFYRAVTARRLVEECSDTNGWFYCAETLIRAEWLGIPITEIPVRWTDDPSSKVKIGSLTLAYLKEIFRLRTEKGRVR